MALQIGLTNWFNKWVLQTAQSINRNNKIPKLYLNRLQQKLFFPFPQANNPQIYIMQSISQMNSKLSQLNSLFTQTTNKFAYSIHLHENKFTMEDFNDFQNLIERLKDEVNQRIAEFFNEKHRQHSQDYQSKIKLYTQTAQQSQFELFSFRNQLERHAIALKLQQERKSVMLQHFSQRFHLNCLLKRHFNAIKTNLEHARQQKRKATTAEQLYKKNLMKKVFCPWRRYLEFQNSLTYKDGYGNSVIGQTQHDIKNVHSQYSSIVRILKEKIQETEDLIKVKKAAKSEFSYALSKNLMKTISNLSLQVMSLNQMSIQDGEYTKSKQEEKFMCQVDKIIQSKIKKVNEYKENLRADQSERQKQRRIRFL